MAKRKTVNTQSNEKLHVLSPLATRTRRHSREARSIYVCFASCMQQPVLNFLFQLSIIIIIFFDFFLCFHSISSSRIPASVALEFDRNENSKTFFCVCFLASETKRQIIIENKMEHVVRCRDSPCLTHLRVSCEWAFSEICRLANGFGHLWKKRKHSAHALNHASRSTNLCVSSFPCVKLATTSTFIHSISNSHTHSRRFRLIILFLSRSTFMACIPFRTGPARPGSAALYFLFIDWFRYSISNFSSLIFYTFRIE